MKKFIDAEGRALGVGDRVEIKHCVGPYGQTRTIRGVIKQMNELGGVTVTLESEPFTEYGRYENAYYKAGDDFYVCGAFEWKSSLEAYFGLKVHDSYDHGHTAYCRII